jgi:hypothetical protein
MSLIVQNISENSDKSFYIFTKGADSSMLPNLHSDYKEEIINIKSEIPFLKKTILKVSL